jgi:hypothetical protein
MLCNSPLPGQRKCPPLCTVGADTAGPSAGARKWLFCSSAALRAPVHRRGRWNVRPGGIRQIRPLLLHRRAADCLPDAPAGPIALLTIQACLADLADAGKAALLEKLGHCADARDILVLPGMSGWQAGRHAEAWSQLVRGTGSASRLLGGSVCPMAGRRRVSGVWREVL